MSADRAKKSKLDLCDTVTHNMPARVTSTLKDARAVRSALALRSALLGLLERYAFEQITIREITAEAGVHYATFFRHHPTKEALLDAVAADQIRRLTELVLSSIDAEVSLAGFRHLCGYIDDNRVIWTALLSGGAADTVRAELMQISHSLPVSSGSASGWLPIQLAIDCAVGVIVQTLTWWLKQQPGVVSAEECARILYRLTLAIDHGVKSQDAAVPQ